MSLFGLYTGNDAIALTSKISSVTTIVLELFYVHKATHDLNALVSEYGRALVSSHFTIFWKKRAVWLLGAKKQ